MRFQLLSIFVLVKLYNIYKRKKLRKTVVYTIELTYFFCSLNSFQSHIFSYISCSGVPFIRSCIYFFAGKFILWSRYMRKEKYEKLQFNPINGSTYEWSCHNCITGYMPQRMWALFLASYWYQWNLMGIFFFAVLYEQEPILNFWIFKRLKRVMFLQSENITELFVFMFIMVAIC